MRGRKPDGKERQRAKGNPGRRAPRKKRETAEQAAAAVASAAPSSPDSAVPAADQPAIARKSHPKFLDAPRLKEALAIWRELEPDLRRLKLLQPLDRFTFAMYCVHMSDWITATRDIKQRGQWKQVKNINGDPMPRMNPSVKVREIAERHILEISARFGLDPANRYKLLRDQAAAPKPVNEQGEMAFDQANTGATPPAREDADEPPSPLGLMEDLSSPVPPGTRAN